MFGTLPVQFVYQAWEREKETFPTRQKSFQPQALDELEDFEAVIQLPQAEYAKGHTAPPSVLTQPRLAWLSEVQKEDNDDEGQGCLMLAVVAMLRRNSVFYEISWDLSPQCI